MKSVMLLIIIFLVLLNAGCGTTLNHTIRTTSEYGGVRYDCANIKIFCEQMNRKQNYCSKKTFLVLLLSLDLPISAIGDTLMFPIDYFYWSGKPPVFPRKHPMDPQ